MRAASNSFEIALSSAMKVSLTEWPVRAAVGSITIAAQGVPASEFERRLDLAFSRVDASSEALVG